MRRKVVPAAVFLFFLNRIKRSTGIQKNGTHPPLTLPLHPLSTSSTLKGVGRGPFLFWRTRDIGNPSFQKYDFSPLLVFVIVERKKKKQVKSSILNYNNNRNNGKGCSSTPLNSSDVILA
jgi:hypothetical protein